MLCLLFLVLSSGFVNTQPATNFKGIATDLDSGEPIYKEIHCLNPQAEWLKANKPWQSKVVYLTPNNKILAIKRISFDDEGYDRSEDSILKPRWVPNYEFKHQSIGFSEAVNYRGNRLELRRKETTDESWESKQYSLKNLAKDSSDDFIADAGFNNYIQEQLQLILSGKELLVTYFSAPRLHTIALKIKLIDIDATQAYIRVSPQNMFIRWLVAPINLVYNLETGRLQSFSGLTNVPANKDQNFNALIKYHYGDPLDEFCG